MGIENIIHRRPRGVTSLALGVLSIAVLNLLRLYLSTSQWEFLSTLPGVPPLYLAITGFVWGIACLPVVWGLWVGKSWAPPYTRAVVLTYMAYDWLDRIFVAGYFSNQGAGWLKLMIPTNWQFAVGFTIIILVLTAWVLGHPAAKEFFGDEYERKP